MQLGIGIDPGSTLVRIGETDAGIDERHDTSCERGVDQHAGALGTNPVVLLPSRLAGGLPRRGNLCGQVKHPLGALQSALHLGSVEEIGPHRLGTESPKLRHVGRRTRQRPHLDPRGHELSNDRLTQRAGPAHDENGHRPNACDGTVLGNQRGCSLVFFRLWREGANRRSLEQPHDIDSNR